MGKSFTLPRFQEGAYLILLPKLIGTVILIRMNAVLTLVAFTQVFDQAGLSKQCRSRSDTAFLICADGP